MDPVAALTRHIDSKRSEIEESRKRVEILETELRVWEEAYAVVTGGPIKLASSRSHLATIRHQVVDRRRGPKGEWRSIMVQAANQLRDEFNLDDLNAICATMGEAFQRNTLRSQVANYVNAGWLHRVKQGRFRFTEMGRQEISQLSQISRDDSLENEKPDAGDAQASGLFAEADHTDLQRHQNIYPIQSGEYSPR